MIDACVYVSQSIAWATLGLVVGWGFRITFTRWGRDRREDGTR